MKSSDPSTPTRAEQKAQTRQRILKEAARLFREQGYAATGVDAIMEAAGLTAGGFYAHFKSKDDLLEHTLSEALDQSWNRLTAGLEGAPAEKRAQLLARYLSPQHRDNPGVGCPLVGIAAELTHHSEKTAALVARHLERLAGAMGRLGIPREQALGEFSKAVGALLLARLVRGQTLSDEILRQGRR
ncbi:MAG TPA: TetR/AcrR family transcriptional regulator [Bdellovibrionota bacterium]|nr:TetR/AcrR family transcriptional regulator [Bdellovibrionota bacterium]